ncbi:hypothetical protein Bca52824_081173 [Brassica carinata]|uniref:Uncharacterized protein n=1 Tax=Brassica carinata TaxID=52824 RepID=A0A8X7PHY7_BRACI|nr:hypothetical protein Bca52824_081173 [Brassica carinata]
MGELVIPVIPGIGGKEISWLGGNPSNITNEVMRLGIPGMLAMGTVHLAPSPFSRVKSRLLPPEGEVMTRLKGEAFLGMLHPLNSSNSLVERPRTSHYS